jgi:hypothetical protein
MNGFPVLFGIFAVFLAFWKSSFFPSKSLHLHRTETWLCCGVTAACAGGVCWVLLGWSASDVREDWGELSFYLVASLAAIAGSQALFAFLGVSLRDDVIERRNRGALSAFAGLTIGASCCIAGANVGNGPGAEVVLLCAVVSTGTLLLLWSLLACLADAAEAITVERDSGAGLRAGGFLAGSGAICGAAVAGDWVSFEATLRDFARFVWPLLAVAMLVTLCERTLNRRPLARRLSTRMSASLAAGLAMLGVAYAVWVAKQ